MDVTTLKNAQAMESKDNIPMAVDAETAPAKPDETTGL